MVCEDEIGEERKIMVCEEEGVKKWLPFPPFSHFLSETIISDTDYMALPQSHCTISKCRGADSD